MNFIDSLKIRLGFDNQEPKVAPASNSQGTETNSKDTDAEATDSKEKAKIYNLIIVDESGSMSYLRDATLSGINETINTIKAAQKAYANVQEHFVTLVTFDAAAYRKPVRTIMDAVPADQATEFKDYSPYGSTPLYDAMGISLTALRKKIAGDENATGVVTVLTDGMENASRVWRGDELRKLIEELKEDGWAFSYMGSAHNVKEVSDLLSIDNVMEFSHDSIGAANTWERERSSKSAYFEKMAYSFNPRDARDMKKACMRELNENYYVNRVTPSNIETLKPNEIFVFGSDPQGSHAGGAACLALHKFGAQRGKCEGLHGNSYAIPTTGSFDLLRQAIARFCDFAEAHPELMFYVTSIGCGNAGYSPEEIAPMFAGVIKLENVALPANFWTILGLKMF